MAKKNPFALLEPKTKTMILETLDGAEVTVRELSQLEGSEIASKIYDVNTATGEQTINMVEYVKAKFARASAMLVEPEMSVEDLQALTGDVVKVVNEIVGIKNEDAEDTEDNEESGN